jgi:flagellar basal body P-ring protein FlgI
MKEKKLHIDCPHCNTKIVVDAATGEILSHTVVEKKDKVSFDDHLKALSEEKQRSEEVFSQQMKALGDKGRVLEEKFKEALEKAKKLPKEPKVKDIDLD